MTYRRPTWQTLTLTVVIATLASALLAFSRPVEMVVDGQRIESDVPPVTTTSDRIFVPLRSVADALGAETIVDAKDGAIYVVRGNQSLRLRVGSIHATINGMPMTLKHPPFRVRGRLMISLKAISLAFSVRTNYDPRTARVEVVTPGIGEAQVVPTPETQ